MVTSSTICWRGAEIRLDSLQGRARTELTVVTGNCSSTDPPRSKVIRSSSTSSVASGAGTWQNRWLTRPQFSRDPTCTLKSVSGIWNNRELSHDRTLACDQVLQRSVQQPSFRGEAPVEAQRAHGAERQVGEEAARAPRGAAREWRAERASGLHAHRGRRSPHVVALQPKQPSARHAHAEHAAPLHQRCFTEHEWLHDRRHDILADARVNQQAAVGTWVSGQCHVYAGVCASEQSVGGYRRVKTHFWGEHTASGRPRRQADTGGACRHLWALHISHGASGRQWRRRRCRSKRRPMGGFGPCSRPGWKWRDAGTACPDAPGRTGAWCTRRASRGNPAARALLPRCLWMPGRVATVFGKSWQRAQVRTANKASRTAVSLRLQRLVNRPMGKWRSTKRRVEKARRSGLKRSALRRGHLRVTKTLLRSSCSMPVTPSSVPTSFTLKFSRVGLAATSNA